MINRCDSGAEAVPAGHASGAAGVDRQDAMDTVVSKALQDKLYDKRKAGALEYVLCLWFAGVIVWLPTHLVYWSIHVSG